MAFFPPPPLLENSGQALRAAFLTSQMATHPVPWAFPRVLLPAVPPFLPSSSWKVSLVSRLLSFVTDLLTEAGCQPGVRTQTLLLLTFEVLLKKGICLLSSLPYGQP